jgi:hypothetical protein
VFVQVARLTAALSEGKVSKTTDVGLLDFSALQVNA